MTSLKTGITYDIGRGVPVRWRPHLKAEELQWLPAFEAADFSNAICVPNAPTPEQDPAWFAQKMVSTRDGDTTVVDIDGRACCDIPVALLAGG